MALQCSWNLNALGMPVFDRGQKIFSWMFTIVASNVNSQGNANPYVAGGDTLDLGQLFGTQLQGNSAAIPGMSPSFNSNTPPSGWFVQIQSQPNAQAGTGCSGYSYQFRGGSTLNNCKMQVFQSAAAGNPQSELAAGNYPAAILNDVIVALATIPV